MGWYINWQPCRENGCDSCVTDWKLWFSQWLSADCSWDVWHPCPAWSNTIFHDMKPPRNDLRLHREISWFDLGVELLWSWSLSFRGVLGDIQWGEQHADRITCPVWAWDPPGGAGGRGWGERCLGYLALPVTTAIRHQINNWKAWMNGWTMSALNAPPHIYYNPSRLLLEHAKQTFLLNKETATLDSFCLNNCRHISKLIWKCFYFLCFLSLSITHHSSLFPKLLCDWDRPDSLSTGSLIFLSLLSAAVWCNWWYTVL